MNGNSLNSPGVKEKKKREPLLHIVKKDNIPLHKALFIRIFTIILALVFAGLFTLIIIGENPIAAYATMFEGVFGPNTLISLRSTAILLCIALALTPAFKMRFWNTGAEGQVLVGGLASAFCMYYFYELPAYALLFVMLIASILAGAIWAVIPAIFKAIWGTNETLFTLMMNSVATFLTLFFMKFWNKQSSAVSKEILDPDGKINKLMGTNYFAIIAIVLLLTAFMYIYLKYSKHGYEISVVGESENTARYIGIDVRKVIIRTLLISGLICGLAGFLIVAPSQSIAGNIVGGQGFTAIMVAWLAKFNPLIMILSAFLFIFVAVGGQEISTALYYDAAYADILIGILLFFIIGCEFFTNYKIMFNEKIQRFNEKITDKFKTLFEKLKKPFTRKKEDK